MTEAEWFTCTDSTEMLELLRDKASDRKLWLVVAACARSLLNAFGDKQEVWAEVLERYADGRASAGDVFRVHSPEFLVKSLYPNGLVPPNVIGPAWDAAKRAAITATDFTHPEPRDNTDKEMASVCHLVRDIFGSPFRHLAGSSFWPLCGNGKLRNIADAIYADRAFDRLPILVDALEEAGCHDRDILGHCRQASPHVRGCWVVDLVLGRQ
jgi:hypothetical protein